MFVSKILAAGPIAARSIPSNDVIDLIWNRFLGSTLRTLLTTNPTSTIPINQPSRFQFRPTSTIPFHQPCWYQRVSSTCESRSSMAPIRTPRLKLPAKTKKTVPPPGSAGKGKNSTATKNKNKAKQAPTPTPPPPSSINSSNDSISDGKGDPGMKDRVQDQDDTLMKDPPEPLLPVIDPAINDLDSTFREVDPIPTSPAPNNPVAVPNPMAMYEVARKLRDKAKLDDKHFQDAIDILNTPGGPMIFLVFREMQRYQEESQGPSKSTTISADQNPGDHSSSKAPAPNFQYSNAIKDRIRDLTKEAFMQADVQCYTRKSFKPGTGDRSLLTITMQGLQKLPADVIKKELPPGFGSGDGPAMKNIVAMVRKIQRHVRLSVREKLLDKIIDPETKDFNKDGVVPKLQELTETLYRFLHPVKTSLSNTQVIQNMVALFLSRVGHLCLQTLDHLLHPHIKKSTQWSLIDQKLHELNAHTADYRAVWSKAILAKDNEIFGKNKTILEIIDEDIVGMPNEDDVQFQLDVLL
ncbi:hypothetical protein PGT21_030134 [Puccinia graminis f. sp. tritici]|uniref:Uncharacterized protein n=1 Tax=Puccinia graminis f. sp. tritici TaxID=56615 RepID=A0A5B0PZ36_PUCGR|nr:hypothetical protein PGT21_030134 [Puccinia graminis f. sp. tritici]